MKKKLISLSLILMTSSYLFAEPNTTNKKIETISEAEKKAIMEEMDFSLPSAGALANSLTANLGKIDWAKFMDFKVKDISRFSRQKRALYLGAKGADAYFLVFSKDSANLNGVSKSINNTLNKIIINKKPLAKRVGKNNLKKLEKSIKSKKWSSVLEQINNLKNKIAFEFEKSKENDLKILNDVGGWLEGYRIAVEGFNTNFKAETTDVLVQNDLIEFLLKEMKDVKSFTEKDTLVKILQDINAVLSKATKEHRLSKKQVVELSKILVNTNSII